MAKLIINVKYQDVAINDVAKQKSVSLNVLNAVNLGANNAKDLISTDPNNDLKLGSDNKLLSQPTDTDYLAYYILAKG